jgi:hypothetical protein
MDNRRFATFATLVNSVALFVGLSSSAMAAPGGTVSFNHMETGYPLTGAHVAVACVTCHVDGMFSGTPRTCDGCHALGRRVVATPKSGNHVVTDAPCEACHFNTATFLGARFNHATTKPEQCTSCHNGRVAQGRPANHNLGKKATDSCDHCHRTSAFIPSSWNHIGVMPGSCDSAGCHVSGSNQYYRSTATHTRTGMATYRCDDCHNFVGWIPARYKHTVPSPTGRCDGCHNNAIAASTPAGHVAIGTDDCGACHTSTVSWLGALGAKPANHIPYNAGASCSNCHTGNTVAAGNTLHAYVSPTCKTCHNTSPVYLGSMQRRSIPGHERSTSSQDCVSCHSRQFTRWNEP